MLEYRETSRDFSRYLTRSLLTNRPERLHGAATKETARHSEDFRIIRRRSYGALLFQPYSSLVALKKHVSASSDCSKTIESTVPEGLRSLLLLFSPRRKCCFFFFLVQPSRGDGDVPIFTATQHTLHIILC